MINIIFLLVIFLILVLLFKNKTKILNFLTKINLKDKKFLILFLFFIFFSPLFSNTNWYKNYQKEKLKQTQKELKKKTIYLILTMQKQDLIQEENCYKICQLNNGDLNSLKNLINDLKIKANFKIYEKNELILLKNSELLNIASEYGLNYSILFNQLALNFIENLKFEVYQRKEGQKV